MKTKGLSRPNDSAEGIGVTLGPCFAESRSLYLPRRSGCPWRRLEGNCPSCPVIMFRSALIGPDFQEPGRSESMSGSPSWNASRRDLPNALAAGVFRWTDVSLPIPAIGLPGLALGRDTGLQN